jgi:Ala-tRNA(Pro) deacylase
MPPRQIIEFLDKEKVPYEVLAHAKAYTAQGVAASVHVRGRDFAKAVIVKAADGRRVMAVIPGPRHVDLKALEGLLGTRVELAREEEFATLFPGCELGAEPPLGNLYGLPVYADQSLHRDPDVVFNAGTHSEVIRMKWADYQRVVQPVVATLSTPS